MLDSRLAPGGREGDGLPLVQGGQGRDGQELEQDGRVVGVAVMFVAAVFAALAVVAYWIAATGRWS